MRQGDLIRALGALTAAGVGAGLALAGAAITGNLGGATTIERYMAAPLPARAPRVPAGSGLSLQQIYRLDAPGVVHLTSSPAPRALGSGFVIDKAGHIVTSNQVIAGAEHVQVSFSGEDAVDARIVGKDPSTDVALLQISAHSRSLRPLPLGDSDGVQVGDTVVAIGNTSTHNRTASAGIVNAVQRGIDASAVGHSIATGAVNDGNSGGPLIDEQGQVIGVGSRAATAIPIDLVKTVVAQLLKTGKVEHAFLGLDAVPVTGPLASSFNLPCNYGLLVQTVRPGSGAARAGFRAGSNPVVADGESYLLGGDIIVAADGEPIASEAALRNVIQVMKPGQHLSLGIWRGHARKTVVVILGRPPG